MTEAWPRVARPQNPGGRQNRGGSQNQGAILAAAAALAGADGRDGLSASALAMALGRGWGSPAKSGSRQELQLAVVTEAGRIFDTEVVQPALTAPAGLGQLAAVCEAFFGHLQRHACPGGSFMASAALELGTRGGPVKDLITALQARFGELIRSFAAVAVTRNELPGEDPGRLAFELNGIMLAADTNFVQHEDPAVLDLARQIVRQRLGVGQP